MCDELKCQHCGKIFPIINKGSYGGKALHEKLCKLNPNKILLNYSYNSKKREGGWECQVCHTVFSIKRELHEHLSENPDHRVDNRRTHDSWKCEYCKSEFKSRRFLYEHYKTCEEKAKLPHDSRGHVISQKVLDGRIKARETINKSIESGNFVYTGHPHTEESKRKISTARHKNLENGIGNHWINPHIKMSYAEQYFYDCFTNANLSFKNNVWINHYCVDFLFDNNIYIEVDGEQHFTDDAIKHDIERDKFLLNLGYKCLCRIRWASFSKLSYKEKHDYICNLIKQLNESSILTNSIMDQ